MRRRGFAKPPNIILCWLSFFCENSGSIERKGAETIWTIVKYDWKSQQVFLYGKYLLNVLQQCAKATEQTPSVWWKFFSAVTRIQKHINHVFFLAVSSSDKRIKGFVHAGTVDYKAKFTLWQVRPSLWWKDVEWILKYCQEVWGRHNCPKIMPFLKDCFGVSKIGRRISRRLLRKERPPGLDAKGRQGSKRSLARVWGGCGDGKCHLTILHREREGSLGFALIEKCPRTETLRIWTLYSSTSYSWGLKSQINEKKHWRHLVSLYMSKKT